MSRQAGALDEGNFFDENYAGWSPADLLVPSGLTPEQIDKASRLVFEWQRSSEPYATPLVLELAKIFLADEV